MLDFLMYSNYIETFFSNLFLLTIVTEIIKASFLISSNGNELRNKGTSIILGIILLFMLFFIPKQNNIFVYIFLIAILIILFYSGIVIIVKPKINSLIEIIYIFATFTFTGFFQSAQTKNYINIISPLKFNHFHKELLLELYLFLKINLSIIFVIICGFIIIFNTIHSIKLLKDLIKELILFVKNKIKTKSIKKIVYKSINNPSINKISNIDYLANNINKIIPVIIKIVICFALVLIYIIILDNKDVFGEDARKVYELICFTTLIPLMYDNIKNKFKLKQEK